MKFSFKWLQKFVQVHGSASKLAAQLTDAGLEVESVDKEIIDVSVPPNRGDCLGIIGIAREAAALNQLPFSPPSMSAYPDKTDAQVNVYVKEKHACPRYLGRVVKNVDNTKTTPQWMQDCLTIAGMKVISPIVDITNYVMLEWGQPLHAFDLAKTDGNIVVRYAKSNEELLLLDGTTIKLLPDSLVIADSRHPLALAGIKGGMESGITAETKDIILECAYFDPVGIRLTSRKLKVQTDGSYRHERCIDPNMQEQVMARVTQLIVEIVGGEPGPIVEAVDKDIPRPVQIILRTARVKKILGITIDLEKIVLILESLGMAVNPTGTTTELEVTVPTFRPDITREIDLIEELVRIYGYSNIPAQATIGTLNFNPLSEAKISEARIADCLVNRGYNQAIVYSFIEPEFGKKFAHDPQHTWTITNPISSEMALMRPSLLPGLIKAVEYNQNRQQSHIRLFEIGLRFEGKTNNLQQIKSVAGIYSGNYWNENWSNLTRPTDYYDVQGDVQALFDLANLVVTFQPIKDPNLQPGQSAGIFLQNQQVGKLGVLHPELCQGLDLQGPVVVFELNYDAIANGQVANFKQFSKFPEVRRDFAILVDQDLLSDKLVQAIKHQVGELLTELVIFDVYQGKGIAPGKKSVGLGVILGPLERTLTDSEINKVFDDLISMLSKKFNVTLR